MSSAIGNAKGVDLNSASAEDLDRIGGLGHDRVRRIVENRPFRSWEDLKRVGGSGSTFAEDLENAGATLSKADDAPSSPILHPRDRTFYES